MDKTSFMLTIDTEKMLRLRELAAQVRMSTRYYCAMILDRHIQSKADIDAKGEK